MSKTRKDGEYKALTDDELAEIIPDVLLALLDPREAAVDEFMACATPTIYALSLLAEKDERLWN